MKASAPVLVLVILSFAVLTGLALVDVGYLGIFDSHMHSWAGAQVLVDLSILAVLSCLWMARDSRTSGVPAWPFVALTLAGGSFGVLGYLLARTLKAPVAASSHG